MGVHGLREEAREVFSKGVVLGLDLKDEQTFTKERGQLRYTRKREEYVQRK